jgi:hypothetical protein
MKLAILMLSLAITFAACAADPLRVENEPRAAAASAEVHADVGTTFRLKVGEIAALSGTNLLVAFNGVRNDSRCPGDVDCVWAGNAEVLVGVAVEGGRWSWSTLNTSLDPRSLTSNGYSIEVVDLEPGTFSGSSIPARSYVVQLKAVRL